MEDAWRRQLKHAELLQRDYGYTLSEAAQVMGSAMRYSVVNLAGRNIGIAAKIDNRCCRADRAALSAEQLGKALNSPPHSQLEIVSSGFLMVACSGMVASLAGLPQTTIIRGFSPEGRPQIRLRNFIGAGVCVRVATPA